MVHPQEARQDTGTPLEGARSLDPSWPVSRGAHRPLATPNLCGISSSPPPIRAHTPAEQDPVSETSLFLHPTLPETDYVASRPPRCVTRSRPARSDITPSHPRAAPRSVPPITRARARTRRRDVTITNSGFAHSSRSDSCSPRRSRRRSAIRLRPWTRNRIR